MGWEDCHLHNFSAGRTELSEKVVLSRVFSQAGDKILYIYDFGDGWGHEVKLVARVSGADQPVPSCTNGKLAGPPEDCGGVRLGASGL